MTRFVSEKVLVGMVWIIVAGCGSSESGSTEEYQLAGKEIQSEENDNKDRKIVEQAPVPLTGDRNEYFKIIEDKRGQILDKHARLVTQIQQAGDRSESLPALDVSLDDLIQKTEEVHRQIEVLKAAKGRDWLALQSDMNRALEELGRSYDKALAQFGG